VAVSASAVQDRNAIRTVVENDVLKINYVRNKVPWHAPGRKLKAYVSIRQLSRLSASGASKVFVEGDLKADELKIYLSGASDFKGRILSADLMLDQSGASDATISGIANNLSINASGASEMQGYNLETENCTVKASGASTIKIKVNKELFVHASGASTIQYAGKGVITEIKTNGASKISKKT
jgi:hypothetical protein